MDGFYSSDLGKHMQPMPSINSTSRGVRLQHSLEEIAKYQKIKEEDMQAAALKVCGKAIGAEGRVGCELLLLFEMEGPEGFCREKPSRKDSI